jgi:hypothetical protein
VICNNKKKGGFGVMEIRIIKTVMFGVVMVMVGILIMAKVTGAAELKTIELKYAGLVPLGQYFRFQSMSGLRR